jgi:hypothetical protein
MSGHLSSSTLRFQVCLIGLIVSCSCNERVSPLVFEHLSLIEVAKDFPVNPEQIALCQQEDTSECQNYGNAVRAKASLLSRGPAAMDATLAVIQSDCESHLPGRDTRSSAWSKCIGGLTALYFFSSCAQDDKLLAFFEKNPVILRLAATERDFGWFHNRCHQERWHALFEIANSTDGTVSPPDNPFEPADVDISHRIQLL